MTSSPLSKHDELLLEDLKLQPLWLLVLYIALGLGAVAVGLMKLGFGLESFLLIGGGFLIALGAEKLVSRRIRRAASKLISGPEISGPKKETKA